MARAIMVQGTMSNAGKSLLAAGLCRIFAQDGHRVAPFKSQNMALNSYITSDGLEMGRAQVMQAEAARIEPDVAMNPVLLKPTSDVGSQVIVMGEVVDNMQAAEYFRYKKHKLRELVVDAYNRLAAQYDIIVLEGAGSPAEINLIEGDIVNMGMAKIAGAPVLLAGDIDPGGVFAQLFGTVRLVGDDYRQYIKGLVINKFRGDPDILRPGLADLEQMCGMPILGIVPYLHLDLDDEDSLAPRLNERNHAKPLDIAVVRVPYLSNFTDFNAIGRHQSMGLRYVEKAEQLGRPDLLILPGSKNTMGDLEWMRGNGMAACVAALAAGGTPVIGICGGYQMLGRTLRDPLGVEGGGEMEGLGLLPVDTVFTGSKSRSQSMGRVICSEGFFAQLCGLPLEGYEIHMGSTTGDCPASCRLFSDGDETPDGACAGNVLGSYLHGFFDTPELLEGLAGLLMKARCLPYTAGTFKTLAAHKEQQYEMLAENLRQSLDMDAIYRILEEGI